MAVQTIYNIANDAIAAILPNDPGLKIIDTATLVSVGQKVLNSDELTGRFLNHITQRIGKTMIDTKRYTTRFLPFLRTDMEWGAIVQEIKVKYGDFKEDPSDDLKNGESVDMYVINKPELAQKFYTGIKTYSDYITISRALMKDCFTDERGLRRVIAAIFTQLKNKLTLALERLGYLTLDNYIAVLSQQGGETQVIHMLTDYNTDRGTSLTEAESQFDKEYMLYATSRIRKIMRKMSDMSARYNIEGDVEFNSPESLDSVFYADFMEDLRTFTYSDTRRLDDVLFTPTIEVNYWQSEKVPDSIQVTPILPDGTKGAAVKVENIIGMIYDHTALGIFQHDEEVSTTPYNSAGRYYNTWYHEEQLWYNNFGKNAVLILND